MGVEMAGGWWWPEDDNHARVAIPREVQWAVPWFVSHTPGSAVVVQAGGNVGIYAAELRRFFRDVISFEPHPENIECFRRNIQLPRARGAGLITLFNGGLWSEPGTARLHEVEPHNYGAYQVRPGGSVPLNTIDALQLEACDGIWLDVEGAELPALKGAIETIRAYHPVIACEEKGLGSSFGYHDAEIEDFLSQQGYHYTDSHYSDRLYTYAL